MAKIKKYGPPSAAVLVARHLSRLGIDVDPLRLEEAVAAEKSRQRVENREDLGHVRSLAAAVMRARREVELVEFDWRSRPGDATLRAAQAAQRSRTAAEQALLEACFNDKAQMRAALRG